MASDTNTPRAPDQATADGQRLRETASREASSAQQELKNASRTIENEASRLASGAKEKALESAESGKSLATGSLNDFTAAIRKASDELGERDQSMAANLVREAASGLEQVSGAVEGKSVQELVRSVAGFARRQPTAFLIGAALAGVAIGRFAKASADHDDRDAGANARPSDAKRVGSYNRDSTSSASTGETGYRSPSQGVEASARAGAGSGTSPVDPGSTPTRPAAGSATGAPPIGASSRSGTARTVPGARAGGETTRAGAVSPPGTASSSHDRTSQKGGDHER